MPLRGCGPPYWHDTGPARRAKVGGRMSCRCGGAGRRTGTTSVEAPTGRDAGLWTVCPTWLKRDHRVDMAMVLATELPVPDRDGVLTAAEACAAFGRGHVRAQLAARRWQRPRRGIIVRHNGPLTAPQTEWVALLGSPPGSALGGMTALLRDGLEGFTSPLPRVVIPEGRRRPAHPLCVPHWSRELSDADVHPLRTPRRTRPQRSLVDEASWCAWGQERHARSLVLAGVQQRLVVTRDLRDALTRRGPCRHRRLIIESILDAAGGVQSLPERDFDLIRRERRLPEPDRQSVGRRGDGKYYLDVEWRRYDAGCEVHGIPHLAVRQWESDLERANEISIGGLRLLLFSSYAVRRHQQRVGDQLERLLRRGGWRG